MHPVTRRLATRPRRALPGFTLIELIVTIVILGILAALAVPAFNAVIDRSRVATAEAYWEAVAREASALAAFSDTVAGPSHFATALADGGGTAAQVLAAGSEVSYTLDDGDGVLSEGEYIAVYESSTLWLFARPAGLDHVVAVQSLGGQLWAVFSSVPEAGHTDGAGGVLLPTDRLEDCCDVDGDGVADLVLTLDPAGSTHLDRMIVAGPPDQATVDAAGPELAIAGVAEGGTYHGTVELVLTATDASGVATVALDVDGTPLTLTDNGDGTHSTSWDTSSSDGATVLTASATDTPGNPSELVVNVTVALPTVAMSANDATAPTADEQRLAQSIEAAGYQVQLVSDADLLSHDHSSTVAMVIHPGTSMGSSSALRGQLTHVPLFSTMPNLGFFYASGSGSYWGPSFSGNLLDRSSTHPVAAGLPGTIDVLDNAPGYRGVLQAHPDGEDVFGYNSTTAGVVAVDHSARHVLFGPASTAGLNAAGDQLIANILDWITAPVPGATTLTATRSGTEATLTWDATTPESSSYQVSYRLAGTTTWTTQETSGTSTTVTGLSSSDLYDFRVRGVNAAGRGLISATVTPLTPQSGTVAFSVADPGSLDSQLEQPFVDRLTDRGVTVQLVDHDDLATADLSAADLLIVPAMDDTDSATHPNSDIDSLGLPVLSMNSWTSSADLGLGSSRSYTASYRNISNPDPIHPVMDLLNAMVGNGYTYTTNGPMSGVYDLASDARSLAGFAFSSSGNYNLVVTNEPSNTHLHFGAFRGDLLTDHSWAMWDGAVSTMLTDVSVVPPTPLMLSSGNAAFTVDWDPVAGASAYEVYHRHNINSTPELAGRTTDTSLAVTGLADDSVFDNNQTYVVWVRSVDADGETLSTTLAGSTVPVTASDSTLATLSVALAVDDPASLTQAEELLRSYLAARGASVTTVADSSVASHDFSTTDVLLLPPTSTVASSTVSGLSVPTVVTDGTVMATLLGTTSATHTSSNTPLIDGSTLLTSYDATTTIGSGPLDALPPGQLDVAALRASPSTNDVVLGGHWLNRRVAFFGLQDIEDAPLRAWRKLDGAIVWAADSSAFTPTDLALSRPASGQITTEWAITGPTPDSQEIRHREVGTTTWTTATIGSTPSHTLTGLTDSTGYEVQVRTSVSGQYSAWSAAQMTGAHGGGVTVAFNVKNASSLHSSLEQPFHDRLVANGYTVNLVSDAAMPTWTPSGDLLVVRPHSVFNTTTAHPTFSDFDTLGMPVLSLDSHTASTADLGLITSAGWSSPSTATISSLSHPISSPLGSNVTLPIYTRAGQAHYASASGAAVEYMRMFNATLYLMGVADDTGAHRQAWFGAVSGDLLTGAGHYLFDQAVAWTAATP